MIVDWRGGAEMRCWESHKDRRPGEYVSRSHGRASSHVESWACKFACRVSVESVSRRCVQVLASMRIRCS
jgi:hypothetical protein